MIVWSAESMVHPCVVCRAWLASKRWVHNKIKMAYFIASFPRKLRLSRSPLTVCVLGFLLYLYVKNWLYPRRAYRRPWSVCTARRFAASCPRRPSRTTPSPCGTSPASSRASWWSHPSGCPTPRSWVACGPTKPIACFTTGGLTSLPDISSW